MATSPLVIFETVFTLQKRYGVSREKIRDLLADILSFRGLVLPNKNLYKRALDLYSSKNISFVDAYNVTYMTSHGIAEIYSFDADFDRVESVTRLASGKPV